MSGLKKKKFDPACLSCGSSSLYENRSFGALPRVTSDCATFSTGGRLCVCLNCGLVQKIIDERWQSEITEIYSQYKIFELTGGADQIAFDANAATRGDKIVDILSRHIPESFSGSLIDIGCGTGGFLKAFGKKFPQASLYGREIDDRNLRYLQNIPNFKTLFTGTEPYEGCKFDIITSIHCFEHIYEQADFLNEIDAIRKDDAPVLIQVPDVETSPFDIVIADHAAHFSCNTLQRCLNRHANGFVVTRPIHKELTALATSSLHKFELLPVPSQEELISALEEQVNYLIRMLELIDDKKLSNFGVYGTTIAGGWLTASHGDKIAFYVDDDPLKQGKMLHGKNIIAANQVPDQCKVVLPFGAATVSKILDSHPNLRSHVIYFE